MARRATAIEEARKRRQAVLVLDAGDSIASEVDPGRRTGGATSIEAMNLMGYDAVALGERDLKLGVETLRQRVSEATFPILSANVLVRDTGTRLLEPYAILDVEGRRVAIIGLTGTNWDANDPIFQVVDPVEALAGLIEEVAQASDLVIVLSHASLDVERQIVNTMPAVSLVISGGDEYLDPPELGSAGGLIVHADRSTPGHAGLRIGVARFAFDPNGVRTDHAWQALSLGPEVPDHTEMVAWLNSPK